MVIFGIKISSNKKVYYALNKIFGIGLTQSFNICKLLNITPNTKVNQLTDTQISNITKLIKKNYIIEDSLRKYKRLNIRRLSQTKSYRGMRHIYNLPVRGQRTSTNARTRKRFKRN